MAITNDHNDFHMKEYEMSNLGLANFFLVIELIHISSGIFITQRQYIHNKPQKFGLKYCNMQNTPMNEETKLLSNMGSHDIKRTLYYLLGILV
jgi:hypothetical protein